ncbi:MAG: transcription termination factor Rho [Planctomycetaceae bacterium]
MAPRPSRPTRRTTRKPRPADTEVIEEFDRESELSDVDFGDDEPVAEEPRRGRGRKAKSAKQDDDFGADIVPEDRSTEARASAERSDEQDDAPRGRRRRSSSRSRDAEPAADSTSDVSFDHDEPTSSREEQRDDSDVSFDSAEPNSRPERQGESRHSNDNGDYSQKRGRRRRRRGRGQRDGQNEPRGGGGGGYQHGGQQRGRFENQRGGRGGNRHDRGRQQGGGRHRHQKAAVGESHEPPVMSGTFEGVLELHPKRYGFLRTAANDYSAIDTDPFVSSSLVEKYNLREGIKIVGEVGPGVRGQGPRLLEVTSIDGRPPEDFANIKNFDHLTPINPFEMIKLETGASPITMRVMDLLTPIGKGQRALIVAPPRSGKTMLLQDIANSVSQNHPEVHLIVLLIDERPEEVTDMRRMVNGEVIASSMDRDVESHVRISQLVMERGKRIAEAGGHCFILMDSITRCARAFNKWVGGGRDSKTMTGGLDHRAMEIPRKLFGLARRFDEGGSLTVAATALIDTGSRMDEAIFQEFKGTGNMELVLSRDLADRRIWPAIDITKSGTRREEKLLSPDTLEGVTMLRRALVSMSPTDAMIELTKKLQSFPSNAEFLNRVRQVL